MERAAGAIELLNTLGTFIGAHRKMMALSRYLREYEQWRRDQKVFPAPPRPDEVRAFYQGCVDSTSSPDPRLREAGQSALREFDFDFLLKGAQAYWGEK
jgi:hypothetical protein